MNADVRALIEALSAAAGRPVSPMDMVREFREKFDASKDPELWINLIREELNEFDQALQNLLKEYIDLQYVLMGGFQVTTEVDGPDLPEDLSARTDVAHMIAQLLFPPQILKEAFKEVHRSNMSKLGEDGKPIKREDGKVLKGPNYSPADLSNLVSTKAALVE